jgi:maltooligosyltrehalose trehalohydrolase
MPFTERHPWQQTLGAVPLRDGGVEFRVWAPHAQRVAVRLERADGEPAEQELEPLGGGVHAATVADARPGDDYRFVLDDGVALPDPASRHQAAGLRGPSRVVDPHAWNWTDEHWGGVTLSDLVIYELHVGTFTARGTFEAAIADLERLRDLGITAIELMPVADFPGERGWGYDGVYISAAHEAYGGPEGLQRLVDAAHATGLGVILDVVYNHVGASGAAALEAFGPYFTDRYSTFWGRALNYDDAGCDAVREWVIQSACWWIDGLHLDGLRLDAIHAIYDFSARHLLAELTERVHAVGPRALVIAESGLNDARTIRPVEVGGHGLDAQWADDFHHALHVLLTGEREGYYGDFGRVADLTKAYHRPFVHDGTWSAFRNRTHGAPAPDRAPEQFVVFSQNHDQVGNRALGDRLAAQLRPLAAFCSLLSPFTPLVFMGEEYGEDAPFQFFCDHIDPDIAQATREGRRREFADFAAFSGAEVPDPQAAETFARSKLTRARDEGLAQLYTALLRARRALRPWRETVASFDERARWLRVGRGPYELLCNFDPEPQRVPTAHAEIVLSTHPAQHEGGGMLLPGRSGALVR